MWHEDCSFWLWQSQTPADLGMRPSSSANSSSYNRGFTVYEARFANSSITRQGAIAQAQSLRSDVRRPSSNHSSEALIWNVAPSANFRIRNDRCHEVVAPQGLLGFDHDPATGFCHIYYCLLLDRVSPSANWSAVASPISYRIQQHAF